MDILITSTLDSAGFVSAQTQIKNLITQISALNKALAGMGASTATASKVLAQNNKQVQVLGNGYSNYLATMNKVSVQQKSLNTITKDATATAEKYRVANQGVSSSISPVIGQIGGMNTHIQASTGYFQKLNKQISEGGRGLTGIKSGIQGFVGGLKNISNTAASVGDVFGFYIGVIMLGAVKDLIFGFSILKDEAISTFSYLKMPQKEIEYAIDGITKTAARLPRVAVPELLDGWKKVRLSTKVTGDEMVRFSSTFGDTITLFKANGRTAEAAALALTDAMSGGANAFRRMREVSGSITKEALIGKGWSGAQEDVEGFFTALNLVYKEMGVEGISKKLESFADIMDYIGEMAGYAGMQLGDKLLVVIKPLALAFGELLSSPIGPWITGLGIAFMGLFGSILVGVPLLQSFGASWAVVGATITHVTEPITTRLKAFRAEITGTYGDLDKFAKTVGGKTAKMGTYSADAEYDKLKKAGAFKGMDGDMKQKWLDLRQRRGEKSGISLIRIDPATKEFTTKGAYELTDSLDKVEKKAGGTKKTLGAFFSSINPLTKTGRTGLLNFGKAGITALGDMLTFGFGLSNPIGWLLILGEVIAALAIVFVDWGRVIDLAGDAWARLGKFLAPARKYVTDLIEKGYKAIVAWKGWDDVGEYLKVVGNRLKVIFGFAWSGLVYIFTNLWSVLSKIGGWTWKGAKEIWDILPIKNYIGAMGQYNTKMDTLIEGIRKGKVDQALWNDTMKDSGNRMIWLLNPLNMFRISVAVLEGWLRKTIGDLNEFFATAEGTRYLDAMRIAWDNLKNALVNLVGALSDVAGAWLYLFDAISGDSAKGFWNNAKTVAGARDLLTEGGTGGPDYNTDFWTNLKTVLEAITTTIYALAWVINNVLVPAFRFGAAVIFTVVGFCQKVYLAFKMVYDAVMWVKDGISQMSTNIPLLWLFEGPLKAIICLLYGCSPGIIPGFIEVTNTIRWFVNVALALLQYFVPKALKLFVDFFNKVVDWWKKLPGRVAGALTSLGGQIWAKINDAYNYVVNRIHKFYDIGVKIKDQVVSGIKKAMGISSPSTVMADMGEAMGEGLLQGMSNWVDDNIQGIANYMSKTVGVVPKILSDIFSGFKYVFYYNSRQSITSTLQNLTGNCYDAATAFIQLANSMGITAQMYRTFVNGIPHRIVNLPQFGMWIDPSGILGTGIHSGTAPGSPAGMNFEVYIQDPVVKEEEDFDTIAGKTSRRIADMLRFGV